MPLLELKDIHLDYRLGNRTDTVLKRVDLRVERGEMVGILGPSGSGKSTLLYILGCLLKPTSGSFHFADQDVPRLDSDRLAHLRSDKIGFVFQQFHLLPRADLIDNVLLASRYHRSPAAATIEDPRERAIELLRAVGLEEYLHHLPNQLSGGQQQRVAIARALMNNPDLILADEPTGNLDSQATLQVLELLQKINQSGRTIILITHDADVAAYCARTVTIRDGTLSSDMAAGPAAEPTASIEPTTTQPSERSSWTELKIHAWSEHLKTAWQNLLRNKTRSVLTMLGVTIGIAAVLATITLGAFTRSKILESYQSLGVNKLVVRAYYSHDSDLRDVGLPKFVGVDKVADLGPLKRLFPQIKLISPVLQDWGSTVEYGGHSDNQASLLGVAPQYFAITNRRLAAGQPISYFHQQNHSGVCVIGAQIYQTLFKPRSPLRQTLQINGRNNRRYSCMVIGVLDRQSSNSEWINPNEQVLMPESYLSLMEHGWSSRTHEFDLQFTPGASIKDLSTEIQNYFHQKYGHSIDIHVDSDDLLVAQMKKFLDLFAILLAGIAFISLGVGGIGITNMMLVAVSERFKEIGLRKALGARDGEIRTQLLTESIILCALSGFTGVAFGLLGYHGLLYMASKLFPKVQFEWVFNWPAIGLSVVCIFAVGLLSGMVPALRAEKLEVVEALRSE